MPRLRLDARLARVARANCSALAEVDGPIPAAARGYLTFLLKRSRVRDAVHRALAVRYHSRQALQEQLSAFLRREVAGGGLTHFGVGSVAAKTSRLTTVVFVRRLVDVRYVKIRRGGWGRICGVVERGRRPRILITRPDGRVVQKWARRKGRWFCRDLRKMRPGKYTVEVMVDRRYGPEVAALFPIYFRVKPPSRPLQKLYPPAERKENAVAKRLLSSINASRKAVGLSPLIANARLADAARAHSDDMNGFGFFGHVSPRKGQLSRRLAEFGLRFVAASENLALATGPRKAHDSLMLSPSHRRNLLDPRMTQVGIGVSADPTRGLFYITECFARLK